MIAILSIVINNKGFILKDPQAEFYIGYHGVIGRCCSRAMAPDGLFCEGCGWGVPCVPVTYLGNKVVMLM